MHGRKLAPAGYAGLVERRWGGAQNPKNMSLGEVGCCLSHRKVWSMMVEQDIDVAMVLEDDASTFDPHFLRILQHLLQHTPSDWGILLLGFWLKNGLNGYAVNQYVHRIYDFVLLHCYLITKAAAQALLRLAPIHGPLDTWISQQSSSVPIYRHTYELQPGHVKYLPLHSRLVLQQFDTSEIGEHTN